MLPFALSFTHLTFTEELLCAGPLLSILLTALSGMSYYYLSFVEDSEAQGIGGGPPPTAVITSITYLSQRREYFLLNQAGVVRTTGHMLSDASDLAAVLIPAPRGCLPSSVLYPRTDSWLAFTKEAAGAGKADGVARYQGCGLGPPVK